MSLVIVALTPVIGLPGITVCDSVLYLVEVLGDRHITGVASLSILLATASLIRGLLGMDNVMEGLIRA